MKTEDTKVLGRELN